MKLSNVCTILAATAAFALAGVATGQADYVWVGGASGDETNWRNQANWECDNTFPCTSGYPDSPNHVVTIGAPNTPGEHPVLNLAAENIEVAQLTILPAGFLRVHDTSTPSFSNVLRVTNDNFHVESAPELNGALTVQPNAATGLGQMDVEALVLVEGLVTIEADDDDFGQVRVFSSGDDDAVFTLEDQLVIKSANEPALLQIGNSSGTPVGGKVVMDAAVTHQIAGRIEVTSTSTLEVLQNATFAPWNSIEGLIRGHNDAAEIMINTSSGNVTLTNDIVIAGRMKINGDGNNDAIFKNLWEVSADDLNGTIEFGPNMLLQDGVDALWEADGGRLYFNLGASWSCSLGTYRIDGCGTLEIVHNLEIDDAGNFEFIDGTVETNSMSVCLAECESFNLACGCFSPECEGCGP